MREERQLELIREVLASFPDKGTLARHLKAFYSNHRMMGSGDRRRTSDFVYNYFRLQNALEGLPVPVQLALSNYLCADASTPLVNYLLSVHTALQDADASASLEEKIKAVQAVVPGFNLQHLFPLPERVSPHISFEPFVRAHLRLPLLWVRAKRQHLTNVLDELKAADLVIDRDDTALALPTRTQVELLHCGREGYIEIQDLSSQLAVREATPGKNERWWDACAASGGKSLALADIEPSIRLTVSDVRSSILNNLRKRFAHAGLDPERIFAANLTDPGFTAGEYFDGILLDAPCSGSGTWTRMPEWLARFRQRDLDRYSERQVAIANTCCRYLKPGGKMVYITCSVYEEENEAVVEKLLRSLPLEKISEKYLEGWKRRADTMYVAVLKRTG